MDNRFPWFLHPIVVFIFSILALASSLFLYIYWYVGVSAGLQRLVGHYHLDPRQFLEAQTWVVILVLSILVAIILAGTLIIFVYSQKMVRLNRLQHEFIHNFTHELKTPVTSLRLYLETLLKHELPREERIKYITYMLRDAERLTENINSILNLARIETKTYGGEYVIEDLAAVMGQFIQNNRHLFGSCEIVVHNPAERGYPYRINKPLFEMLLMNLLNNGVQYNDSEKPCIDIRFEEKKQALHILFEDNGLGIEKGEQKKIFRKFYRAARTTSRSYRGSGLGLYLVRNIARMHKGKVIASNLPDGGGAVFTLILPFQPQRV